MSGQRRPIVSKNQWQCMDCAANSNSTPSATQHQIVTAHVISAGA